MDACFLKVGKSVAYLKISSNQVLYQWRSYLRSEIRRVLLKSVELTVIRWFRFLAVQYWGFFHAVLFSSNPGHQGSGENIGLEWPIIFHRSWQIDNYTNMIMK